MQSDKTAHFAASVPQSAVEFITVKADISDKDRSRDLCHIYRMSTRRNIKFCPAFFFGQIEYTPVGKGSFDIGD